MSEHKDFDELWAAKSGELSKILTDLAFKSTTDVYNPYENHEQFVKEIADELVKVYSIVELAWHSGEVKGLNDANNIFRNVNRGEDT